MGKGSVGDSLQFKELVLKIQRLSRKPKCYWEATGIFKCLSFPVSACDVGGWGSGEDFLAYEGINNLDPGQQSGSPCARETT